MQAVKNGVLTSTAISNQSRDHWGNPAFRGKAMLDMRIGLKTTERPQSTFIRNTE